MVTASFPRVRYLAERFSKLANDSSRRNDCHRTPPKTQQQEGKKVDDKKAASIKGKKNKSSSGSEEADDIVFVRSRDCLDRSSNCNKKESPRNVRSNSDSEVQLGKKSLPQTPSRFQKEKDLNDSRSSNSKSNNGNPPKSTRQFIPNPPRKTNNKIRYGATRKAFTSTPNNSSSDLNVDLDFGSSLTILLSDVTTDDALESHTLMKSPNDTRFKKPSPITKGGRMTSPSVKGQKKTSSDLKSAETIQNNNKNINSIERKTTVSSKTAGKSLSRKLDGNTTKNLNPIPTKNCSKSPITNSKSSIHPSKHKNYDEIESILTEGSGSSQAAEISQDCTTQLLHPAWRRVPWKDYFGWDSRHQSLMETLKTQKNGGSIYYMDEEEYEVAKKNWINSNSQDEFLNGPWVTSVFDMLAVIEKEHELKPKTYGSLSRRNSRRKKNTAPVTTCYDAESESCS